MPVKLAQALANPLFPALDSALRAGRHIGLDELDNHAFLMDFQDYLEEFYARYNVELIRAPEGFFYLRPRSTTLISRSVLSELDMMVGKILCYLYLSPERLANEGIFTQQELYDELLTLADESRLLKLVNNLIQSTTPKGSHESDPFWTKAETALLQAIILMLFQEAPEYEQNFSMVMRVLEYAEVREEDEGHVSPLDLLFESIERRKPDSVAVRQYKVFKLAAGKTAKSILVSTAVRLAPFNLPQIQALTDHDDMNLYTLGEKKVALYAVIPDNDNTFVRPDRAPCNAEKWYCPA